jgi:hypothetical protein
MSASFFALTKSSESRKDRTLFDWNRLLRLNGGPRAPRYIDRNLDTFTGDSGPRRLLTRAVHSLGRLARLDGHSCTFTDRFQLQYGLNMIEDCHRGNPELRRAKIGVGGSSTIADASLSAFSFALRSTVEERHGGLNGSSPNLRVVIAKRVRPCSRILAVCFDERRPPPRAVRLT